MKSVIARCIIICSIILITANQVFPSLRQQKIALVIGNGDYQTGRLNHPRNDAADLAWLLNELGFGVTLITNASKREIEEALNNFGRDLKAGGVGLFYFAGHGMRLNGTNYLIPTGADIQSRGDVSYEAVNANRVLSKMKDAGNPLNMVFLDACRINPFAQRIGSTERGLAQIAAPEGCFVAYAAAPGNIAAQSSGRNGIFARNLLRLLRDSNLELIPMMRKVRAGVLKDTGGKQNPFTVSALTGSFYFNPGGGEKNVTRPVPPDAADLPEGGAFAANANGVVIDGKTGLQWVPGPNRNTSWKSAKKWVAGLRVDGGGWRLPTRSELKSLFQKGVGSRNMTPLLKTTGWWVWSGEMEGSSDVWGFDFYHGYAKSTPMDDSCYVCPRSVAFSVYNRGRAFAVRSRTD